MVRNLVESLHRRVDVIAAKGNQLNLIVHGFGMGCSKIDHYNVGKIQAFSYAMLSIYPPQEH